MSDWSVFCDAVWAGHMDACEPFLHSLRALFGPADVVTVFPAGRVIYRARAHPRDRPIASCIDLVAPPLDKTQHQRMSPKGTSYFYGATDVKTARIEAGQGAEAVTVGKWHVRRQTHLFNLVNLPDDPDDPRARAARMMRDIAAEMAQPVEPDGDKAVLYRPTQLVVSHLRENVPHAYGDPVEGMFYPSALAASRSNLVFFVGPEDLDAELPLLGCPDEVHTFVKFDGGWHQIDRGVPA
jgi:hypothetical protein